MKFLLRCKNCGNRMLYESRSVNVSGKSKVCVFCGKSFRVRDGIVSEKPQ